MQKAAARLSLLRGPLRRQTAQGASCCFTTSSINNSVAPNNSSSTSSSTSSSSSSGGGAPFSLGSAVCSLLRSTGPCPVLFHWGSRSLEESSSLSRQQEGQQDQLVQQLHELEDEVLAANWGDTVALIINGAIWDARLLKLEAQALPFLYNKKVAAALESVRRLFDLLHITEDIRDHINEIIEQEGRSSGIAGTGLKASPPVENVAAHASAAASAFDALLVEYPEYGAKTEESLGFGLAVLRQKNRFPFARQHHFFF